MEGPVLERLWQAGWGSVLFLDHPLKTERLELLVTRVYDERTHDG